VCAVPQLRSLLAGAGDPPGRTAEERIAELLARPGGIRSLHRPIVGLDDGRCLGHDATVHLGDDEEHGPAPWFRAAARTGLSGRLGATALAAVLRERATMPGDRFLVVTLDPHALGHPEVGAVLAAEDDVADLVLRLIEADVPVGRRATEVLDRLRTRGLRLAVPAGTGGVADLALVDRLGPDVVLLGADLVRDVQSHRVRQRLVDVVVELADDCGAITLAEEVETLEETQVLRSLGVRMAAGWLFGRPRTGFVPPPPEVCEWLRLQQIDLR
jgi:EAL domain-containing protein (putative c-di-GMP-specific phosphodiesterase class I)